jgi:hypothetical protein
MEKKMYSICQPRFTRSIWCRRRRIRRKGELSLLYFETDVGSL